MATSTNGTDESMFYADAFDMAEEDRTCPHCGGDGMHPIDDCMPCQHCDGEGYEWWN